MRQLIMMTLVAALTVANAFAWWETIIDTVETRWPDGQLKEQYTTVFFGGNERTWKEGPYRSWYQNGQLEYDGAYDNDLKAHTWTKWDSLGWKVEQVSYLAGKKHGKEITWHPNLTIHKTFLYRRGEPHGICTLYKPGVYVTNRDLAFEAIWFYVEGALLATVKHPDSGSWTDQSAKTYYDSTSDVHIEQASGCHEFYVGKQVDGKKHGKWILWTAQGYKQRVDFYQNGELLEF